MYIICTSNENEGNMKTHVLDLIIDLEEGIFDKRDDFPFRIVQFVPANSNVFRSLLYGVFGTQVIRYFRIINNVDIFVNKVNLLIDVFRNHIYKEQVLINIYSKEYSNHKF